MRFVMPAEFIRFPAQMKNGTASRGKESTPPYYISYTVHDTTSSSLRASFGAVDQDSDSHQRIASVEVRVGDYTLDNTHPMRGDNGSPRVGLFALPLTDEDAPTRVALWRATDRAFKGTKDVQMTQPANRFRLLEGKEVLRHVAEQTSMRRLAEKRLN